MTDVEHVQDVPLVEQADVDELTKEYARYLQVDATKERQSFYDSIDEMLTKLDEFGGLVDLIRSDTTLCVNKTVPEIQAKCEAIKQIFTRVDQLEAFVNIVKQNVSVMEGHVNKAENEMGSLSGFKKKFSTLFGSKKPVQSKDARPSYIPPEIYVTEEYLRPSQPVVQMIRSTTENTEQAGTTNTEPSDKEDPAQTAGTDQSSTTNTETTVSQADTPGAADNVGQDKGDNLVQDKGDNLGQDKGDNLGQNTPEKGDNPSQQDKDT